MSIPEKFTTHFVQFTIQPFTELNYTYIVGVFVCNHGDKKGIQSGFEGQISSHFTKNETFKKRHEGKFKSGSKNNQELRQTD